MDYHSEFRRSIDNPEDFWREQAGKIDWIEPPGTIWQPTDNGHGQWFPDGVLNSCDVALDANIRAGRGDQKALIYDSPVTGTQRSYSYNELTGEVARFAGALTDRGITKGDRVIIYMPMIPEAVIAMLACARIGAIHSVVFGGFAAHELAVRIDDAKPRAVITASCGIEVARVIEYKPLVDKAIEQAGHKPETCIVYQRPQVQAALQPGRDHDWQELVSVAEPVAPVPVRSTDPLYILYTSGTTGKPKGVQRVHDRVAPRLPGSAEHPRFAEGLHRPMNNALPNMLFSCGRLDRLQRAVVAFMRDECSWEFVTQGKGFKDRTIQGPGLPHARTEPGPCCDCVRP